MEEEEDEEMSSTFFFIFHQNIPHNFSCISGIDKFLFAQKLKSSTGVPRAKTYDGRASLCNLLNFVEKFIILRELLPRWSWENPRRAKRDGMGGTRIINWTDINRIGRSHHTCTESSRVEVTVVELIVYYMNCIYHGWNRKIYKNARCKKSLSARKKGTEYFK